MINLTISGRVGVDAKKVEHGIYFTIASTERGYTKQDNTVVPERTTWFNVFSRVDNLLNHIKKGDYLTIYTKGVKSEVYNNEGCLTVNAESIEFGGVSKGS